MAYGADASQRQIRVRLVGAESEGDVSALQTWLAQERTLDKLVEEGVLRIQQHGRANEEGEPGTPMGAGLEILLVLVGAASAKVFDDVYEQTKRGVRAWRENRRTVQTGEPPEAEVTEVTPDDGGR